MENSPGSLENYRVSLHPFRRRHPGDEGNSDHTGREVSPGKKDVRGPWTAALSI